MDFSFPKSERIKSKKVLERIFTEGNSMKHFPIKLFYLPTAPAENTGIQVAVAVPKRNFKRAVDRNRIKRLLRETYRKNKHLVFNNMEGNYAFVFLYLGKEMPDYPLVERKMISILHLFLKKNPHEKAQ